MDIIFLYALGIFSAIFALYLLGISVAPFKPNSVKVDHFECGLPPSSSTPQKANFGFFTFAIFFIIVDMAGLFISLMIFTDSNHALNQAMIFSSILAVAVSVAMKIYRSENA